MGILDDIPPLTSADIFGAEAEGDTGNAGEASVATTPTETAPTNVESAGDAGASQGASAATGDTKAVATATEGVSGEVAAAKIDDVKAEDKATEQAATGSKKPADAVDPSVAQQALDALKKVAELIGVSETDPTKLTAAIEAKHTEAATQEREQRIQKVADATMQEIVQKNVRPLVDLKIQQDMRNEGYDVRSPLEREAEGLIPNWWEDPANTAVLNEFSRRVERAIASDEYKNIATGLFEQKMAPIREREKRLDEVQAQSAGVLPAKTVAALRAAGADTIIKQLADENKALIEGKMATYNSTISAKDAEIAELRAQLATTAKAEQVASTAAKKVQDGLSVIANGQSLPIATAQGGPVRESDGRVSLDLGSWNVDSLGLR